ncbi:MAG: type III secretion chaperone SycN [Planctomycetota bacterium]|jgi:type III secretion system chaperone SycN|nr:type III secretion chaperone SycN [Planctomycetota bacterium]
MGIFASAIAEFGNRLNLPGLTPGASGRVDLSIEKLGRLQIEEADGFALVTLARPWPAHAARAALTALDLCHWRENHPWPLNAGAKDGEWLLFTAGIPLPDFSLPELERALNHLSGLLDAVEKAG